MLEEDERHVRRVLGLLDLLAAAGLVEGERAADARVALEGLVERDRVLHGELGARADGEMRRRLGVADSTLLPSTQRLLRIIGKLRQIERLIRIGWPSRNQPKMLSISRADSASLIFGRPARSKVSGIGLEHPGRAPGLVLVGVRDEGSPLGLLEDEGEGVERPRGAHPGELVRPKIDLGREVRRMPLAEAAVDAVGHDDEVGIGKQALVVHVGLEDELDAELAAPSPAGSAEQLRREQPQNPLPPIRWTRP